MKKLAVGILAHVDAGKTTLSEAMLYMGGSIRKMGRVDRGDAFLDTYELEKKRGITIFSKQAILKWKDMEMTLLDTPGHVDFSAEMERTLQVLDYAILVISGTDGVQEHTRTLWRLLARYRVPTFLFINKMDLAGLGKGAILDDLRKILKETFVDFGEAGTDHFYEQTAMTSEELLDEYLETGHVETAGIREQIINRRLFPCFFGSALKFTGVEEFMKGLEEYTETPEYPPEFGAKIFKISRDAQGNRMSHMKITGGSLSTREIIDEEKVNQIRLYSGEKFETVREASAGTVCAVLGLSKAVPGQGLGVEAASAMPLLEPVMTYRIGLPEGVDAAAVLPKFRELEEEDPELHLTWEESKKEIHVQIMGELQTAPSLRGGPSSFGTRGAGERYAVCFRLQRGYSGKKLAAAGSDPSGGEGAQGGADGFFGHGYEDHADVGACPFKAYGGRRFPPGCLPGSPPGTDAGGIHAAGAILRFPP